MGGRFALYITIMFPERVRSTILASASPGLADPSARLARRRDDEALAERIEARGIELFAEEWERQPVLAHGRLSPTIRQELRHQRLRNNARGLANSLRGMGTGAQPSLWDRLGEIERPVLLLAGEHDGKFLAINRQMASAISLARLHVIPAAGHMLHLEQPAAFGASVVGFVSATTSNDGRQPLPQREQDDEDKSRQRELLEPGVQGRQNGRALDGQPVAHQQRRDQQE